MLDGDVPKRTKEKTLAEMASYWMLEDRRSLIVAFINKICLSVMPPIPMVGNSHGDDGPIEKQMPGVYWDYNGYYLDVDVNEDNLTTLSLFSRDRNIPDSDKWLGEFKADNPEEPYSKEWLEEYFKPLLLV